MDGRAGLGFVWWDRTLQRAAMVAVGTRTRGCWLWFRSQPWHAALQVSEGRNPTATNHLSLLMYFKIRWE